MDDLKGCLNDAFSASERADIQQMADELILETGLQLLREELNLSQKTVAEAMGVK